MTSRAQIIETLRTFKTENAEKYGIERMSLFGSMARGEHNENSDVDLLIKFKSPSLYLYAELADALETILGRKVDIVSESARKRPGFYEEISKDLIALLQPSSQKFNIRGVLEAGIGGAGAFEFAELPPLLFG